MKVQLIAFQQPLVEQFVRSLPESEPCPRDRGRTGAGIGLDHIAIDQQRSFAEGFHVDHGPKASTDQALDFLGTT